MIIFPNIHELLYRSLELFMKKVRMLNNDLVISQSVAP